MINRQRTGRLCGWTQTFAPRVSRGRAGGRGEKRDSTEATVPCCFLQTSPRSRRPEEPASPSFSSPVQSVHSFEMGPSRGTGQGVPLWGEKSPRCLFIHRADQTPSVIGPPHTEVLPSCCSPCPHEARLPNLPFLQGTAVPRGPEPALGSAQKEGQPIHSSCCPYRLSEESRGCLPGSLGGQRVRGPGSGSGQGECPRLTCLG